MGTWVGPASPQPAPNRPGPLSDVEPRPPQSAPPEPGRTLRKQEPSDVGTPPSHRGSSLPPRASCSHCSYVIQQSFRLGTLPLWINSAPLFRTPRGPVDRDTDWLSLVCPLTPINRKIRTNQSRGISSPTGSIRVVVFNPWGGVLTAVLGAPLLHGHLLGQLRQGLVHGLAGAQRQRQPLLYPLHLLHPSAAPGLAGQNHRDTGVSARERT